jgi:hypothetical protein
LAGTIVYVGTGLCGNFFNLQNPCLIHYLGRI